MPMPGRRGWLSILAIAAALIQAHAAAADDVRIRSAVANVRAGGSTEARVLFQVKAGDVLRLLDVSGNWLHVEAADGRRGYVSKALAGVIPSAAAPTSAPAAPPPPAPASGAL